MGAAIEIVGVSKRFKLNHERADSLKERVVKLRKRSTHEDFWALRDIDLARRPGRDRRPARPQRLGQVDAAEVRRRHLAPDDRARSARRGRMAALLELGAGFHRDLTGRENIYMNGSILGLAEAGDRPDLRRHRRVRRDRASSSTTR